MTREGERPISIPGKFALEQPSVRVTAAITALNAISYAQEIGRLLQNPKTQLETVRLVRHSPVLAEAEPFPSSGLEAIRERFPVTIREITGAGEDLYPTFVPIIDELSKQLTQADVPHSREEIILSTMVDFASGMIDMDEKTSYVAKLIEAAGLYEFASDRVDKVFGELNKLERESLRKLGVLLVSKNVLLQRAGLLPEGDPTEFSERAQLSAVATLSKRLEILDVDCPKIRIAGQRAAVALNTDRDTRRQAASIRVNYSRFRAEMPVWGDDR